MAASLGEIFVELGVFADTKELKDFENKLQQVSQKMNKTEKKSNGLTVSVRKFIKGVAGVAAAITGAIYALNRLTTSLVESNQEFLNLTRTSDISLGVFQKWNNVGRMFGVRNAAQQIENLNQRLFELKLTGQGAEGFMLAGINPMGQDAEGIMNQLRNRVAGLDDTAAAYLLRQMGLDPSMLHLLRLSREEFEALGQTVKKYQLTKEQSEQIQALNAQLQIAQIRLKYLKDRAILAIMPYFVRFMRFVADATEGLGKFVNWINKGIKALPEAAKQMLKVAAAIGAITVALLALTAHPIIGGITLLIGAIMLLADDINHYLNGGGSVIGVIAKAMEDFKENGLFGDDVPKWIQLLATAADKLYEVFHIKDTIKDIQDMNKAVKNNSLKDLTPEEQQKLYNKLYGKNPAEQATAIPYLDPYTQTVNNRTNNISNADNRQVIMNNQIMTSQTGNAVISDLNYAQNYAFDFC